MDKESMSMRFLFLAMFLCLVALSAACTAAPTPVPPTAAPTVAPTIAQQPAATPGPTPTLHPAIQAATLPELAKRQYPGSDITVLKVLTATETYTESYVSYLSEGVRVTGILNEPVGKGPFPGVVLAHGYYDPAQYTPGLGTERLARLLTDNGFVTFAPDYRGYGQSEHAQNLYMSGYIIDVLNAGSALKKLPNVDAAHVGLLGHSMGGGLAARAMVASSVYQAFVLYAPISSDTEELMLDPMGGETAGMDTDIAISLLQSVSDPNLFAALSPKNYYDRVTAPVSIHSGTADDIAPTKWAEAIYHGLRDAGKKAEFYQYPGEGHVITGAQQPVFDQRIVDFLKRSLQ